MLRPVREKLAHHVGEISKGIVLQGYIVVVVKNYRGDKRYGRSHVLSSDAVPFQQFVGLAAFIALLQRAPRYTAGICTLKNK